MKKDLRVLQAAWRLERVRFRLAVTGSLRR
jgi:hypothetical protein